MAKAGDRMTSEATGETFVFIKTAADTDGQLLVIDMICTPGGGAKGAPVHLHPKQVERFYIQQGVVEFEVKGEKFFAYPGETITVQPGTPHTWRNPSTTENACFRCELEPAGQWELLFENLCGMAQRNMLNADGTVPAIAMVQALHMFPDQLYIAAMPIWMQKIGFALLSPVAKLLGYKPLYTYQPDQQTT